MKNKSKSFFWGLVAGSGALVTEVFLLVIFSIFNFPEEKISFSVSQPKINWLIISALIEEFFKLIIIFKAARLFSRGKELIANSFLVGVGFATLEIISVAKNYFSEIAVAPEEVAGLFIIHGATAILMGCFFLWSKEKVKVKYIFLSFLTATYFHLIYNLTVWAKGEILGNFLFFLFLVFLTIISVGNFLFTQKLAS